MKKYNLKHIIPVALSSLVILYACNKSYLEVPAAGALSQDVLANKVGVEALLVGAYSLLDGEGSSAGTGNGPWATSSSNWVYGSVAGGDAHKGSDPGDQNLITPIEKWSATASNGYLDQLWQQRYDGVQRANETMRVMKLAKDISAADVTRITAEARFLRGHYHFDLAALDIDFITCAAHKFHGPKGIGFLYVNKKTRVNPLIHGGSQERGLRGGSPRHKAACALDIAFQPRAARFQLTAQQVAQAAAAAQAAIRLGRITRADRPPPEGRWHVPLRLQRRVRDRG